MQMRTASAISAALHVAVLLWATLSFTSTGFEAAPAESLPVDMVSEKQFSEMTKGVKDAPKPVEKPKPLVEKVAEPPPKPVEDMKPKVSEKQEVKTQMEQQSAPAPESKPDPIAEKIDKAEKQEANAEAKPLPPKKPPPPKPPKFDADKIAALLDKRDPQRQATTGATLNPQASLGYVNGAAAQLSQSELDAMRARLRQCWSPPVGAADAPNLFVIFRVLLRRDGSIEHEPALVGGTAASSGPALAESAKRALLQCQPYTMLRPEHYETWRDMEIKFDPRDMFGG
jgi:colicin import membrane protein